MKLKKISNQVGSAASAEAPQNPAVGTGRKDWL